MKEETKNNDEVKSSKQIFIDFLLKTYQPTSDGLQNPTQEFKTSKELQYMLRGMVEPTLEEISTAMMELDFKASYHGTEWFWTLYQVEN